MPSFFKQSLLFIFILFLSIFHSHAATAASKRFKLAKNNKKNGLKKVFDGKLKRARLFNDQIIVKFKKNKAKKSYARKFALKNNLELIEKISKRTYSFRFNDTDSRTELLSLNSKFKESRADDDSVEDFDIDEYKELKINAVKNKTKKSKVISLMASQWHLRNNGENGLKEGADINATQAWDITKGEGVIVAVIDTGFDLKHKDINYLNKGYDSLSGFYDASAPSRSSENHGTAVAGLIAAKDDNKGVIGVAPESQIVPIRLISSSGYVSVSKIISAHRKAIEMGAQIINNSWGSYDSSLAPGESLELTELEKELYEELAQEAVVIFAAGNSSKGNFNNAPEARNPYTLAVGAVNSKDERSSYSVYGDELDLVAPGGERKKIITTDRRDLRIKKKGKKKRYVLGYSKGNYANNFQGTSASAPIVAGVAALILSANPELSPNEVKDILKTTARKCNPDKYMFNPMGWNKELGHGVVDAYEAVQAAINY